jgi:hypothetical protein
MRVTTVDATRPPPDDPKAMQVRAANEPPDHLKDVITTYAQTLSGLGQITAGAAPQQAGTSAAPPTWPRTAATSRPRFPRRHAASWPRPCAGTLTD